MDIGYFFYLSYGHSARLRAGDRPDHDHWAGRLFADLSLEVAKLTKAGRRTPVGYYDDLSRPLANWRSTLARVLGSTDVFVALYSPGYFAKTWPLRERASFAARFADPQTAARFVVPVLWLPWPSWENPAERTAALRLGSGIPEYAEEGLQGLCRLARYRPQYRVIVQRLARQIVAAARDAPRPAPQAVAVDEVTATADARRLTVAVLAPERADRPPGRAAAPYGPAPRAWNPFRSSQRFPVADYAANVAERLGRPARVADQAADLARLADGAALVLVDPWLAETAEGAHRLAEAAVRLPRWATVLLVADRDDPQYAARGAAVNDAVTDTLVAAGVDRARITTVTDADRLADRLPSIIDDAFNAYRKNAPVFLPKGPDSTLPRIGGTAGFTGGEDTHE